MLKNKIVSFIIEIILFYFYVIYIMKPKNRMVWLFILLVVIIFLGVSMGTYESFVAAPRARARVAYNNNNADSFVGAPRARMAYNNNNAESFVAAPRARMAYNNNNM